jgi:hypothetical protein
VLHFYYTQLQIRCNLRKDVNHAIDNTFPFICVCFFVCLLKPTQIFGELGNLRHFVEHIVAIWNLI